MAGYPTDICSTEKDFIWLVLENIAKSITGIHHIAADSMNYSFWLTRRTRCIQYKQWVFSIHFFSRIRWIPLTLYFMDFIFPPYIATFNHGNSYTRTGQNNNFIYSLTLNQGIIYNAL